MADGQACNARDEGSHAAYKVGPQTQPTCECERTDHPQFPDGRCHRDGDGAEQMTGGKVISSPALCLPCLFCCTDDA